MKKAMWIDPETEEVIVNSESVLKESGDGLGDASLMDDDPNNKQDEGWGDE